MNRETAEIQNTAKKKDFVSMEQVEAVACAMVDLGFAQVDTQ